MYFVIGVQIKVPNYGARSIVVEWSQDRLSEVQHHQPLRRLTGNAWPGKVWYMPGILAQSTAGRRSATRRAELESGGAASFSRLADQPRADSCSR